MKLTTHFTSIGALSFLALQCQAQVCTTTVSGNIPAPSTAPGIVARVVSADLKHPRGIIFDSAGHLLVVDVGVGVKALTLQDDGGTCVYASSTQLVVNDTTLNHGIALSDDGNTLYASNVQSAFAYPYDAASATTTGQSTTIVTGMFNTDHSTRTLLMSKKVPGTMLINRGSESNIDPLAANKSSGHGQVKAFNLNKLGNKPFDFTTDGKLLGWGVRNDVGVSEHPATGGIFTVENSVDDISRDGVDFHNNNPGEKLQYMGTLLNNTSPNQGSNFGYPECFAAWAPRAVPQPPKGLKVGQQFSISKSTTDAQCRQRTAPRLVFDAHTAPLDIKFESPAGRTAYITFHGSHDRAIPKGYSVTMVAFGANGMPVDPSTSKKAAVELVREKTLKGCPSSHRCLRPVGLALDGQNRLFFSSDNSGEVYVVGGIGGAS